MFFGSIIGSSQTDPRHQYIHEAPNVGLEDMDSPGVMKLLKKLLSSTHRIHGTGIYTYMNR